MHRNELNEISSEEAQDVISRSPSGMLQWGMLLILFVLVALLGASWLVKYPDVVTTSIEVTTDPSPISVVSNVPGKLKLLKKDHEHLNGGDLIGHLLSNTSPEVVHQVEELINQYLTDNDLAKFYTHLSQLPDGGELQGHIVSVKQAVQRSLFFQSTKFYLEKRHHYENQILLYREVNTKLEAQLGVQEHQKNIVAQSFVENSLSYSQGRPSAIDSNQLKRDMLPQLSGTLFLESSIGYNKLEIEKLENQVIESRIAMIKEGQMLQVVLSNTIDELLDASTNWRKDHLFIAPIDGQLLYLRFLEDEQYIDSGLIFMLLPESATFIAKGELSVERARKIREGQSVTIRLYNYPEPKYGIIRGYVESISRLLHEDKYRLVIRLPEGLRNSHNKKMTIEPSMGGEVEIITDDLRLLERFFYQFRTPVK